ncbi:60S ribosomal protein L25 [Schizosaccharomyces osmophilus]|uniref:60S ribosomal protein L25 n=1 Tax=Schizosaccharomyces osmophilus TaxID=2545709 RepID=A0AAF0AUG1_9SCHI|nr:60S ribosomal protein L25 [Schizosaccharomyces osmophilus]WBW70880.1 60S ribosomal protein L25 [Schizosaccharomyces osmophilus]
MSVGKAQGAQKAVQKGIHNKVARKVRTSTTFRRPKTLQLSRKPKYARKSVAHAPRLDEFKIIDNPINSESAMKKIEDDNTLVFCVHMRANKNTIKSAVKKLYDVDAVKINTMVRPNGTKKAFVKLSAEADALDVANRIGFL